MLAHCARWLTKELTALTRRLTEIITQNSTVNIYPAVGIIFNFNHGAQRRNFKIKEGEFEIDFKKI